MEKVTISKETLQKLLDNFYEACALCDEIYEHEGLDKPMQEMKEWAKEKFDRDINKSDYE